MCRSLSHSTLAMRAVVANSANSLLSVWVGCTVAAVVRRLSYLGRCLAVL